MMGCYPGSSNTQKVLIFFIDPNDAAVEVFLKQNQLPEGVMGFESLEECIVIEPIFKAPISKPRV
jgi:hypothetical protein